MVCGEANMTVIEPLKRPAFQYVPACRESSCRGVAEYDDVELAIEPAGMPMPPTRAVLRQPASKTSITTSAPRRSGSSRRPLRRDVLRVARVVAFDHLRVAHATS